MDSYMWYTHTIHREAQTRVHTRSTTAPDRQHAEHAPADHAPHRRRLRLSVGEVLIAVGARLQAQQQVATRHL